MQRSMSYALPAGSTQRTIQARKATIQAAPLEKPLKMSASAVAYPHPEKVINRASLVSVSQLKDASKDECHPCGVSLEGPQGQRLCCDNPRTRVRCRVHGDRLMHGCALPSHMRA